MVRFRAPRFLTITLLSALVAFSSACPRPAATRAPAPSVVVATVVQRDVPVYSEWVGTTEGFINAEIYPKISGYLLKQLYEDGQQVKAGEPLFQIDDRQYKAALDQALATLAQQQAENKKNEQDLARYKPLYAQSIISKQDYDHVHQAAQASAAAVQAAAAVVENARLNEDWTRVTSPIDGIAGIAKTQVGDLVDTKSLLTTVSQVNPIKVTFPISEREYLHFADKIKQHEEEGHSPADEPALQMILADGSTYPYPGHFYVANRQINIETGTIKIQGLFPNPDSILRPGLYAKIRSPADTAQGALLVPPAAILETQGQYQVAVVGADNRITIHQVTLGKMAGDLRILASGVSAGQRVVTQGLQKVSEGLEVNPVLATSGAFSSSAASPEASASIPSPATESQH